MSVAAMKIEPAMRNGAEASLDALAAGGVDTVFGYPGGAVLPLYDALMDSIPVLVIVEQVARSKMGTDAFQEATPWP